MLQYLTTCFFNAAGPTGAFTGADSPRRDAAAAMRRLLNAEESDCFSFTSGATESNNWVLASATHEHTGGRVVISAIEHPSVAKAADTLRRNGVDVVEIPVDRNGIVQTDALAASLSESVHLVSIIAASNETGVIQPLKLIGQVIRERAPRALFHTDATQAIGKVPIDVMQEWPEVDFLTFSAHKFHGPKGVGGIYVRPGVTIEPMLRGGDQERGLRSGTTNTPGLAGLAAAALEADPGGTMSCVAELRDQFEDELLSEVPSAIIHSRCASRLPNTSCFSIPGTVAENLAQALALDGIIVGIGSACSAGSLSPPKAVLALGVDYGVARGTLRVSLSAMTSQQDLRALLGSLKRLI